jgi:hypothetical protein
MQLKSSHIFTTAIEIALWLSSLAAFTNAPCHNIVIFYMLSFFHCLEAHSVGCKRPFLKFEQYADGIVMSTRIKAPVFIRIGIIAQVRLVGIQYVTFHSNL